MIIKKPLFCNLSSKRDTSKPKYIIEQKTESFYAQLLYALISVITKTAMITQNRFLEFWLRGVVERLSLPKGEFRE